MHHEKLIPTYPAPDRADYDVDSLEVRRGIADTQKRFLELLVRCVDRGVLKAEIKARSATDSTPLPDRTYISTHVLIECLETHGFPRGSYFDQILEDEASELQDGAMAIANQRAYFRHGSAVQLPNTPENMKDPEPFWKRVAEAQSLEIADLRSRSSAAPFAQPSRELSTKERNTLLSIIAVLCEAAGLDPAKPAKTASVLQATAAKMGLRWERQLSKTS